LSIFKVNLEKFLNKKLSLDEFFLLDVTNNSKLSAFITKVSDLYKESIGRFYDIVPTTDTKQYTNVQYMFDVYLSSDKEDIGNMGHPTMEMVQSRLVLFNKLGLTQKRKNNYSIKQQYIIKGSI
jgi:hypothetical protein